MRPYIKNVVNEVKFTYVAEEYKLPEKDKSKKTKTAEKLKKKKKEQKEQEEFVEQYENTVSLNAETTRNLFNDLGYDLKSFSIFFDIN